MFELPQFVHDYLDLAKNATDKKVRDMATNAAYWWIKHYGLRWDYFAA